jgi:hypothetical protein
MKLTIIHARAISTCEPATIAAIASVAAAGVSTYAQVQAGESQKDAANYNAEMGRMKAQDALQRGASEAALKRDKARQVASAQAEGAAMSGVSISTGTPLALLTETAGLGELDALRTVNNAHREAWGYKAQSTLDEFQGAAAQRTGYLNAAGTFLGGASNSYYGYKAGTR